MPTTERIGPHRGHSITFARFANGTIYGLNPQQLDWAEPTDSTAILLARVALQLIALSGKCSNLLRSEACSCDRLDAGPKSPLPQNVLLGADSNGQFGRSERLPAEKSVSPGSKRA